MQLVEIRRNPVLNKKEDNIISILEKYNFSNYFLRFSEHTKLGLNPFFSEGETPFGIYGWPISQVIKFVNNNKIHHLTFFNRKYIIIFQYIGNSTLDLSIPNPNIKETIDIIYKKVPIIHTNISNDDVRTNFLLYKFCQKISFNLFPHRFRKRELFWNKIIRDLGYDSIFDPNGDLMYQGEVSQFCALKPNVIRIEKLIDKSLMITKTIKITNKNWRIVLDKIPTEILIKSLIKTELTPSNVYGIFNIFSSNLSLIKKTEFQIHNMFWEFPNAFIEFEPLLEYYFNILDRYYLNPKIDSKWIPSSNIHNLLVHFEVLPEKYKIKLMSYSPTKEIIEDSYNDISKFEPYM